MSSTDVRPTPEQPKNLLDTSMWKRGIIGDRLFELYYPDVLTKEPQESENMTQLTNPQKPEQHILIEIIPIAEYLTRQTELKKNTEQSSWTNAYAESVHEHVDKNAKHLEAFVVGKEKHDVMQLSATGDDQIKVLQQMLKTVKDLKREETDGIQYFVNFKHNYMIKLPKFISNPDQPNALFAETPVKFIATRPKDETLTTTFSISVISKDDARIPDSQKVDFDQILALKSGKTYSSDVFEYRFYTDLRKTGVDGVAYHATPTAEDTEAPSQFGALFFKDGKYYHLNFASTETVGQWEMNQVINSFRFLSDSEQMQ